ncbi:MAG: selenide, water dikinase SelD [Pseudomonadota bacterium]|jgi:selenide,water dikinase
MPADEPAPFRLTALAHGGGCGCKLSPAVLRELLHGQFADSFPQLLVGNGQADDAAVWQLEADDPDGRCLVATTDFFMPIVDDPHHFGQIAATNAISDIYAMGARPLFALAILGIPLGKVEVPVVRAILAGGAAACRAAGIPVVGGHSIDSAEPIYGLAVVGEVPQRQMRTNAGAQPGDVLILTKPIGVGFYSAMLKRGELTAQDYDALIATTTRLNSVGQQLGGEAAVHALTDVTGFGLIGHGLEMARASGVQLHLDAAAVPLLPRTRQWAQAGKATGASARNWAACADGVALPPGLPDWQRDILTDPQTSGGLLAAVAADAAAGILALIHGAGFPEAAVIGRVEQGATGLTVSAGADQ